MIKSGRITNLQMDLRQRWQAGERIFVERYLRQDPTLSADSEGVLDLIYQEILLRQERGEKPTLPEYVKRFPRLGNELRLQFEVHQVLEESALLGATSAKSHQELNDTPIPVTLSGEKNLVGTTLGDCRVVRFLGQGAMGRVYLGEQTALGRKVALKILRPELLANPVTLQRFQSEARAIAKAGHPNIVQIHAIGESAGMHYLVMEYVEGRTLRQELTDQGRLAPMQALAIMRQVAAALVRAAELGIVHRDIKPDNILLTTKGVAKLSDFGLCWSPEEQRPRLTVQGTTLGTPLYMSPEQIQSGPVDQRSDIYSFGATCYHMLARTPPFTGTSALDVALKHLQDVPAPLASRCSDLPRGLGALVDRMLSKKPEDRFPTAQALLEAIEQIHTEMSLPTAALASPLPPPAPRRTAWGRRVLASALLLLALVCSGFAVWHFSGVPASDGGSAAPEKATGTPNPPADNAATPNPAASKEPDPVKNDPDPRDGRGGQRHRHGGRGTSDTP
jgi:serine/threonine protein kinase